MATTKNTIIPPSLAEPVGGLLRATAGESFNSLIVSLNPKARRASQEPAQEEMTQFANDATNWLMTTNCANHSKTARSAFYSERRREIRTEQFNPDYWIEIDPDQDWTMKATPKVSDFTGEIPAQYDDPNRRPSNCSYENYSEAWETPTFTTTSGEHSPGWHGEVIDQVFRDIWFAAQRLRFQIAPETSLGELPPIAARFDLEIRATSTARGNRSWFAPCINWEWSNYLNFTTADATVMNHYRQEDEFTGELNPANPSGWSQIITISGWRYLNRKRKGNLTTIIKSLWLDIAGCPSHGRYFARNDSVTAFCNAQATIFMPKAP